MGEKQKGPAQILSERGGLGGSDFTAGSGSFIAKRKLYACNANGQVVYCKQEETERLLCVKGTAGSRKFQ